MILAVIETIKGDKMAKTVEVAGVEAEEADAEMVNIEIEINKRKNISTKKLVKLRTTKRTTIGVYSRTDKVKII